MLNQESPRQAQLNKALLALVEYPKSTSLELAGKKGFDRHFLARRLPDFGFRMILSHLCDFQYISMIFHRNQRIPMLSIDLHGFRGPWAHCAMRPWALGPWTWMARTDGRADDTRSTDDVDLGVPLLPASKPKADRRGRRFESRSEPRFVGNNQTNK